jgi:hypothetical protein
LVGLFFFDIFLDRENFTVNGKGDTPRPMNRKAWECGHDKIKWKSKKRKAKR